jgi:hypothetical protein
MFDNRVIKTYVWHSGKCFFVSTIERESSAVLGPRRYNETIVWNFGWDNSERGELIYQGEDSTGSIREHQAVCERIFRTGKPGEEEEA